MALCDRDCDDKIILDRIEQLITYGANLELRDSKGLSALHLAFESQNPKAMKVLLHSGARLSAKTNEGNTAIHLAVIFSMQVDFVWALTEIRLARLDADMRNEDGHTAYYLLRKRNGLRWENYCEEYWDSHQEQWYWNSYQRRARMTRAQEDKYQVILALETLLHQIQDFQGIPKDQQYPPLGPYLSDDKDEEPVPGAWPV